MWNTIVAKRGTNAPKYSRAADIAVSLVGSLNRLCNLKRMVTVIHVPRVLLILITVEVIRIPFLAAVVAAVAIVPALDDAIRRARGTARLSSWRRRTNVNDSHL